MPKHLKPRAENLTPRITEADINKIFISILFILPLIYFAPLLSGSQMMYGSDWLLAGYSMRKWVVDCFKHYLSGPMWDGSAFCGLPFGNPYTFYYLFFLILPIHLSWTYIFVLAMGFAGLGMYLYLKELRLSIYSCFLGALTYMGSGAVLSMTYAGHDGKILATAFFPFILLTLHMAVTRRKVFYFLFAGAIGGIAAINSHFQLIYYAVIVCIVYLIYHLISQRKENGLKGTAKILSYAFYGLLMAAGLMAIHYLPIFGTIGWGARGGERGYAFASSWSMPPSELLDLLTPHFSGLLNNYWGENYFKLHTEYLGILPLLLGLIGITQYRRDKYIRFFIWACLGTIIFALGSHTPIYHLFYSILPGVKKFRAPSMIFYLTSFSISVIAAYGCSYLETQNRKPKTENRALVFRLLASVFIVVVIFALVCSIGRESVISFLGHGIAQQKIEMLTKNYPYFLHGLGIAVVLIAINSILILSIGRLNRLGWISIAALILIIDQWSIDKKFLKTVDQPKKYYVQDEVVNFLTRDHTLFRVFPLYYEHTQDAFLALHGIQSIGGYVSNPGERYQKFIGAGESVMFTPSSLVRYRTLLDILNVKYIISAWIPEDLTQYPANIQKAVENLKSNFLSQWGVSWEAMHNGLTMVHKNSSSGYAIYRNNSALPRAWIVHQYKVLNRDKILTELMKPDFKPDSIVLLENKPNEPNDINELNDINEPVDIKEYTPNKIVCEAVLAAPGILVFSDNWHPDWKVYVDGKKDKLYIADFVARAVVLPNGKHKIEFVYESMYFKTGAIISILALIALLTICIIYYLKQTKRTLRY